MNKNQVEKTHQDVMQEKVNFLMFQLNGYFERSGVSIEKWADNHFVFASVSDFEKAKNLYFKVKGETQRTLRHKVEIDKNERKLLFVYNDKKKPTTK